MILSDVAKKYLVSLFHKFDQKWSVILIYFSHMNKEQNVGRIFKKLSVTQASLNQRIKVLPVIMSPPSLSFSLSAFTLSSFKSATVFLAHIF